MNSRQEFAKFVSYCSPRRSGEGGGPTAWGPIGYARKTRPFLHDT